MVDVFFWIKDIWLFFQILYICLVYQWGKKKPKQTWNISINIVLSLHSPECNIKAAIDYSSQSTANYSFWPCWFVSCKTAAAELGLLIRYLWAECKCANLRNYLWAFEQMKSQALWTCSLCLYLYCNRANCPLFFGLYHERAPYLLLIFLDFFVIFQYSHLSLLFLYC